MSSLSYTIPSMRHTPDPHLGASPARALLEREASRRAELLRRLQERESAPIPRRGSFGALRDVLRRTIDLQSQQIELLGRLVATGRGGAEEAGEVCEQLLEAHQRCTAALSQRDSEAEPMPSGLARQMRQLDDLVALLGDALGSLSHAFGGPHKDDRDYIGRLAEKALDILNTGNAAASGVMAQLQGGGGSGGGGLNGAAVPDLQGSRLHSSLALGSGDCGDDVGDGGSSGAHAKLAALQRSVASIRGAGDEVLERVRAAISGADESLRLLTRENAALDDANVALRAEVRSLTEQLRDAEARNAEQRALVEELRRAAAAAATTREGHSASDRDATTTTVAAAVTTPPHYEESIVEQGAAMVGELREALHTAEHQRRETMRHCHELQDELERVREMQLATSRSLTAAEERAAELVDREGQLTEKLFHIEAHHHERASKAQAELDGERRIVASLRARVAELEREAQRSFDRAEAVERARSDVRRELERKETEVRALRSDLEALQRAQHQRHSEAAAHRTPWLSEPSQGPWQDGRTTAASTTPSPPLAERWGRHHGGASADDGAAGVQRLGEHATVAAAARPLPPVAESSWRSGGSAPAQAVGAKAGSSTRQQQQQQLSEQQQQLEAEVEEAKEHEHEHSSQPMRSSARATINTANASAVNVLKVLADAKYLLTEVTNHRRSGNNNNNSNQDSGLHGDVARQQQQQEQQQRRASDGAQQSASSSPAASTSANPIQNSHPYTTAAGGSGSRGGSGADGGSKGAAAASSIVAASVAKLVAELRAQEERLVAEAAALEAQESAVHEKRSVVSSTLLAQRNQLLMKNAPDRDIELLNEQISNVMQKINRASAQIEVNKRSVASKLELVQRQLRNASRMQDRKS